MAAIALPVRIANGENNIAKAIKIAKSGRRLTRAIYTSSNCFSTRLYMAANFKIVEDRAVRPIVAMTIAGQMLEGFPHSVEHCDPSA